MELSDPDTGITGREPTEVSNKNKSVENKRSYSVLALMLIYSRFRERFRDLAGLPDARRGRGV